jgi:hypothetical protein
MPVEAGHPFAETPGQVFMADAITLDRVTKRRQTTAVRELSSFARSEMFGLIGRMTPAGTATTACAPSRPTAAARVLDPIPSALTESSRFVGISRSGSTYGDPASTKIAFFAEIHGVRDCATRDRLPR